MFLDPDVPNSSGVLGSDPDVPNRVLGSDPDVPNKTNFGSLGVLGSYGEFWGQTPIFLIECVGVLGSDPYFPNRILRNVGEKIEGVLGSDPDFPNKPIFL